MFNVFAPSVAVAIAIESAAVLALVLLLSHDTKLVLESDTLPSRENIFFCINMTNCLLVIIQHNAEFFVQTDVKSFSDVSS